MNILRSSVAAAVPKGSVSGDRNSSYVMKDAIPKLVSIDTRPKPT